MGVLFPPFRMVTMCEDGNNKGLPGSNRAFGEHLISMSNSSSTEPTTATGPRPRRHRRRAAVLAAASAALLSAAAVGCGNGNGDATGPAADSKPAPSATAPAPTGTTPGDSSGATATTAPTTAARSTTGTGSGSGSGSAQAASARCTVTELKMTLGRGDPGAGSIYYPLDFTNTTSHACTLTGFPGVSLLRGDGSVIGKPADRQPVKASAVRLAPGQTVEADLHTLNQGIKDGGCWRTPTLIMVYPPGSKDSMTLATKNPVVCGDTFDVGPVH